MVSGAVANSKRENQHCRCPIGRRPCGRASEPVIPANNTGAYGPMERILLDGPTVALSARLLRALDHPSGIHIPNPSVVVESMILHDEIFVPPNAASFAR